MSHPHQVDQRPAEVGRWSRVRQPLLWGFGLAGTATIVHAVDPNEPGHYPTCPILASTGLYCPGCGFLRSMAALTHGDLGTAFARHPLIPVLVVLLVVYLVRWFAREWRGDPPSGRSWTPLRTTAVMLAYAAFFVARNLPGWSWLSPA